MVFVRSTLYAYGENAPVDGIDMNVLICFVCAWGKPLMVHVYLLLNLLRMHIEEALCSSRYLSYAYVAGIIGLIEGV